MVEEQLINKKTGEELSLSIIDNGHKHGDGYEFWTVDCAVEIKRKRIVSETAKKTAK